MNPTRTKTLLLSSRHRQYTTDTPTRFTCHLDNTLDLSDVKRVVMKSAHILNMFPNVEHYASRFYFTVGGGVNHVATIPAGTYDADTFLTALKTAINSTTAAIVCESATYDTTTFRVTIACNTPFAVLSIEDVIKKYNAFDSLNHKIGAPPYATSAEALTETFLGTINLTGTTHVFIESQALAFAHSADSTGSVRSVIAVVPMTSQYGRMEHWAPGNHMLSMVDFAADRSISTIDISLTDYVGNVLTLPSNAEVTLEFMVVFDSN
jgi:hypothetical protein